MWKTLIYKAERYLLSACTESEGRMQIVFFWPKKILDRDWYDVDDIIAIIPKPSLIEGTHTHYEVDNERWHEVMDKFKK